MRAASHRLRTNLLWIYPMNRDSRLRLCRVCRAASVTEVPRLRAPGTIWKRCCCDPTQRSSGGALSARALRFGPQKRCSLPQRSDEGAYLLVLRSPLLLAFRRAAAVNPARLPRPLQACGSYWPTGRAAVHPAGTATANGRRSAGQAILPMGLAAWRTIRISARVSIS
jgi:hypothetical protein